MKMNTLRYYIFLLIVLSIIIISASGGSVKVLASTTSGKAPASITDLHNTTYAPEYISWTWTDPRDGDFSKVMVYLNGTFQANVSKGEQFYNATGLTPDTNYIIGTHTVDKQGHINQTWSNHTATTAPDAIPPTTNIGLSGDLKPSGWYASYVRVELNATDNQSGVAKTEFSLDNINWSIYTARFVISSEGDTKVRYKSTDNAGNVEIPKEELIRIDTILPQIIIDGVIDEGYYNINVNPTITIIEPNIVSRSTTLNGMPYASGTTITENGSYTLTARATDIVDHVSVKTVNFTIDEIPPLSISNLSNSTFEERYINWTWIDPQIDDFSYVMIYLDGVFKTNVPKGIQFYNETGLNANTQYNISTHTVDSIGNVNQTWVNYTARTSYVVQDPIPCSYSCSWTINYIIN